MIPATADHPQRPAFSPLPHKMPSSPTSVTLHIATEADLAAINVRYADVGFVPSRSDDLIVIARIDGITAGQGRVTAVDATSAELGGIYVLPGCEGMGIARRIVAFLISHANFPVLYCLPFGELAAFYGSMGFSALKEPGRVPQKVMQKHQWCNATYDKAVLLLERRDS